MSTPRLGLAAQTKKVFSFLTKQWNFARTTIAVRSATKKEFASAAMMKNAFSIVSLC
jgi:hypothetical protein